MVFSVPYENTFTESTFDHADARSATFLRDYLDSMARVRIVAWGLCGRTVMWHVRVSCFQTPAPKTFGPVTPVPYAFGMPVADASLALSLGFEGRVKLDDEVAVRAAIFSEMTKVRHMCARFPVRVVFM